MWTEETRLTGIRISAVYQFAKEAIEYPLPDRDALTPHMQTIMDAAKAAMLELYKTATEDETEHMRRRLERSTLFILPKDTKEKNLMLISADELTALLHESGVECAWCERTGNSAKTCRIRKTLVRCGYLAERKGECPLKGLKNG